MAGKQGREPKSVGQRSISSMFSNSRTTAGRSGNGRPLPLMDFLNRKSERRSSLQGGVVDAGLTLEVRERLDAIRKNDIRSNKQYTENESSHGINKDLSCAEESSWPFRRNSQSLRSEGLQTFSMPKTNSAGVGIATKNTFRQGDGIGQCSVQECSTSSCPEETPVYKHRRRAQVYSESSNSRSRNQEQTPPGLEIFNKQSSSSSAVDAGCDPANFQGRQNLDGHLQKNATHQFQSRSVNFIDLTEDEDPAVGRLEREDCLHEENTGIHRKRKRSQAAAAQETTETCPVCNEFFPPHILQAHVESELDALEMLETNSAPDAHAIPAGGHESHNIGHEDGGVGAWEDHPRFRECSVQFKETGTNCSRPRQSVLVLGDEPKYRRQPNFQHKSKRPNSSVFNHYADGAGWWDEGGVGVDAEAVGSASVWEGLGSMSFGGML